jgi:hypothetical protein
MTSAISISKFQEPNFGSWRFTNLGFNYYTTEASLTVDWLNSCNIQKQNLNVYVSKSVYSNGSINQTDSDEVIT